MITPKEYREDPVFEEDTSETTIELFKTAHELGWKPEDLFDKQFAKLYAEWLKTTPPEQ